MLMKDGIRLPDICGKLLNGEDIDGCAGDLTRIDNMLYAAFGMSAEDILAEFRSVSEERE